MAYRMAKNNVFSLEIKSVVGCRISFFDPEYSDIEADSEMFSRYTPVSGDYCNIHPCGFRSFTPKYFRDGQLYLARNALLHGMIPVAGEG